MHRPYALPSGFAIAVYKRIQHRFLVICVSVTAVLCCVPNKQTNQETREMQSSTMIVLACLVAAVVARAHHERYPAVEAVQTPDELPQEALYDTPALERSPRTKRGLLLLKKKLLLGALGLKAAKIGAVGAGVAGAIALKSKAKSVPTTISVHGGHGHSYSYNSRAPTYDVEVHSWSG